jgi:CRP-like cAMP-binding protein
MNKFELNSTLFLKFRIPHKRVIIRQGQKADCFYFIISGQAIVTKMEQDEVTGESKKRIVAILKHGTSFGVCFKICYLFLKL